MPILFLILALLITFCCTIDVKSSKSKNSDKISERDISSYKMQTKASSICNQAHNDANSVNFSSTVSQFETAFTSLMDNLDELIYLNTKHNFPFNVSPQEEKNKILSNMEVTINDFIDRAKRHIFVSVLGNYDHKEYDHIRYANSLENLAIEIENNSVISKYLTDNNKQKVASIRSEATKERDLEEKYLNRLFECIKKQASTANEHFYEAIDTVVHEEQASVSLLQRRFKLTAQQALFLLGDMEYCGIIYANEKGKGFSVLLSFNRWLSLKPKLSYLSNDIKPKSKVDFNSIDTLDGHTFEHFCAELLKKNDFKKVEVTQGSADQGVDVLAEKDGIRYAIQCKCYSSDLGNTPVQEVHAGKEFYKCHVGVVMTNRYFTKGAQELAEKTGTLLWDRSKLLEMLDSESETVLN